ncbi:MAG: hypothetical protein JXA96_06310 [Sedimentisphaerales bacterium]|nr:hypothetical protein [Sedimentisphaerales bacterium]
MNSKTSIISIVILLLCGVSYAGNELSSSEKELLFQKLTSNPKTTWIQAGTMEAIHEVYRAATTTDEDVILSQISKRIEEYQADDNKAEAAVELQKMVLDAIPFNIRYHLSNEYTMKTTKVLKFDGKRFYCDINVDSRVDSVKLPDELKSNYKTDEFNMDWNSRSIICYDGEKNTIYNPSVNHAIIDSDDNFPSGSISILKMGIIHWGYSSFTYDILTELPSSAVEISVDGHSGINLTLNDKSGSEMIFVLDPEKEYAPLSWVVNTQDSTIIHLYSDYKLVSDSWVPTSIIVEKFDKMTNKLLEGDYMTISKISGEIPSSSSFVVDFAPNTMIEYTYDITKPQLKYFYSNYLNTDLLLAERMAYMESEEKQLQNCATASLQYAALQLGRDILNSQLSELVNPADLKTNMKEMKKYVENQGLFCKVVKTDLQTLKDLSGCKAILHIPGKNHFVLLDHIDQSYVWLIDLTKNNFYYRINVSFLSMEWTEGTALLLSNQPIVLQSEVMEIPDDLLIGYIGGSGYSCTYRLQYLTMITCLYMHPNCFGIFELIYPQWACEVAESGTCYEGFTIDKLTWPCINHPELPYTCARNLDMKQEYYTWGCNQ